MSGLSLLARVVCVFVLLGITLWALRRTDGRRRKSTQRTAELQVVGSARLGKGAAVTVVRVGDAEYVLGVTEQSVTLLTAESGKPAPVAVEAAAELPPAPAAPARPDVRRAVTDQLLGRRPAAREGAQTPASTAAFLRDAYRVARGRHADSTDLSAAAVATALAGVRGEAVDASAPAETLESAAPTAEALVTPRSQPAARAADGSAARTSSRHALRRDVARTDALRDEEHPWTRACRPAPRNRVDGSGLL